MRTDIKRRVIHRLKIIEGQIRGLQKLVEREAYCIDVIRQAQASREALSAVEDLMLENHLATHVAEQMKRGKEKRATQEILAVYKLSKKK